ncbi:hypothetical protein BKA67DRAFT_533987 [Truncatella angustata]|uniref:Uncharacterized protein n=1 Tax=Truncatella angustata TaxID=152316 RepID=A0A9P8UN01_9PEZI|nr:uncharacterized protein BKA67DRAFT_533987 [Truncatella angustata]KAH6655040.1 hypothetical protein BKA67DRAFT_533987 [Truncatella angustata]
MPIVWPPYGYSSIITFMIAAARLLSGSWSRSDFIVFTTSEVLRGWFSVGSLVATPLSDSAKIETTATSAGSTSIMPCVILVTASAVTSPLVGDQFEVRFSTYEMANPCPSRMTPSIILVFWLDCPYPSDGLFYQACAGRRDQACSGDLLQTQAQPILEPFNKGLPSDLYIMVKSNGQRRPMIWDRHIVQVTKTPIHWV